MPRKTNKYFEDEYGNKHLILWAESLKDDDYGEWQREVICELDGDIIVLSRRYNGRECIQPDESNHEITMSPKTAKQLGKGLLTAVSRLKAIRKKEY